MVTRYDLTEEVDTGLLEITPVPESHEGRYVTYEDYAALQQVNLEIKTALASQVSDLLAQVTKLTEDLAAYQNSYGPAVTEALAAAQTTGLAFIRVNANGHVQALPSDRVRISVIQAVEERTAAAAHQECGHDYQSEFNGVGYDDICSKCGDTRPEECDHLWQQHLGEPEFRECIRCGRVEDVYE